MSLDVVSMFPNLPHNLILEAISNKWIFLKNILPLSKQEFLTGISTLLHSTFFQFNNCYYHQITGTPMGSCTSPWFADITIEALEKNALEKLKSSTCLKTHNYFSLPPNFSNEPVLLYKRYVDDILLIIKDNMVENAHKIFNNYHPSIQFTIEQENKNKIHFLDLEIIRIPDEHAKINWYRKPTFSGRYLNFLSHHPTPQKKAIIYGLVDKCIFLSDPNFHRKNLELIKQFLLSNNYPLQFINKHIKKRLFHLKSNNPTPKNRQKRNRFIVIPYYKNITPTINNCLSKLNIDVINKTTKKLNAFITLGKDKLDKLDRSNVVYKINCRDCESNYIGQSLRKLSFRLNEHRSYVEKNCQKSVIAKHANSMNHKIDFDNIKILDNEAILKKRLFSEMVNIHISQKTLNKIEDTAGLKNTYENTIDLLQQKLNSHHIKKPLNILFYSHFFPLPHLFFLYIYLEILFQSPNQLPTDSRIFSTLINKVLK